MEERLSGLSPEEQLKQALTELGKGFIGCQLNEVNGTICGIDSSICSGGVKLDEVRISFKYGVKRPGDRNGELILGVAATDFVSLERHSPKKRRRLVIPFEEIKSDTDIGQLDRFVKGRKVAGIGFECPGEDMSRVCFWLSDGSIVYLNTKKGPTGLPRGRAMVRENGVLIGGELPFSKDSGYHLASSEAGSKG